MNKRKIFKNKINGSKLPKSGFTLIELMAMIVILSIISLIVVPLISGIIKSAKEAAFLDTAYGIKNAATYKFTEIMFSQQVFKGLKVNYPTEKEVLEVNGEVPDYGKVSIREDGYIALALWSESVKKCAVKDYYESVIRYDDYVIIKEDCRLNGEQEPPEVFNGWITLTLYYPANATEKMWRLGSEGEVRSTDILDWQEYTGPITIPLTRVEDVWIKYKINNEEVIIPPQGRVLVDIQSTPKELTNNVTIKINYDNKAITKEYKVGNSGWMEYKGAFTVGENVLIEARATKDDSVYDTSGNKIVSRTAVGRDYYYVNNIGVKIKDEDTDLPAPTIERINPQNENEIARVRITYPGNADKKIYKINYSEEKNYSDEIPIYVNGSYLVAYYYDTNSNRSKAKSIYIYGNNDSDYTIDNDVDVGNNPETPTYVINGPTINVSPTTITSNVNVSIDAPDTADKVYIKIGNGNYQLYTNSLVVTENVMVQAYYVTYNGEISNTTYRYINNIKQGNLPYVKIDADPYPYPTSYGAETVKVSITTSDANKVEYSLNGIEYFEYTGQITITQNTRVYARATNSHGVKETFLDITNIGNYNPPPVKRILSVSIMAAPEPSQTTGLVDKVTVSINYDPRATKKYYSYGKNGDLIEYEGSFEVTKNTTIYAYAVSSIAEGQTYKNIDNIAAGGISEPTITVEPNNVQVTSVSVEIEYDKNASIKRYSINGGPLRDYNGSFEAIVNGTIYAYSESSLGEVASSSYTISNIIGKNQILLIDQGDYFILYLNYPEGSKGQEYKFKDNGEWKPYKTSGILLVKAQYKDNVIENDIVKVQIKDDNGNLVDFTGDYYIIDVPLSELSANIFMRWDRTTPPTPQIISNTLQPSKEVNITILYDNSLILKQYKIVDKDGNIITDWSMYNGTIKITGNNTMVYARGRDDAEVWTKESTYKITNIDEQPPIINLVVDLENPSQQLGIRVDVTDDVKVQTVKWAKGIKGISYFKDSGNSIINNSVVTITENDYYTFYASDYAGNEQIYTIDISNIDLAPPVISISINPDSELSTSITVSVDFGDATEKQYKIGTNGTWANYTDVFTVTSNYVINNNLANTDKSVTIYAKGKDSVGNEVTKSLKVINLDLDAPSSPVITAVGDYPIITSTGIKKDSMVTISYDTKPDVTNYYSIDNGGTWIKYTEALNINSGTIMAKSVKNNTGLEVVVSKNITVPGDALLLAAYDGNNSTYDTIKGSNRYIRVDGSVSGRSIRVYWGCGSFATADMIFMNDDKIEISRASINQTTTDQVYTTPIGTKWIAFLGSEFRPASIFEVQVSNEPTFTATNGYMLLHADITKSINSPYQMVSINYYPTSVQRLYKIGSGTWQQYTDQPVWVNQGETIYAKGIDSLGNETRIISSYIASVSDALTPEAHDGNNSTYSSVKSANRYVRVDTSMGGKNIRVYWGCTSFATAYMIFMNDDKTEISRASIDQTTTDQVYTVPLGTKWIAFLGLEFKPASIYEVEISNEPTFTATNGYMLLHADVSKIIKSPYQMVTINYFPTSVQRLYKIGSGTWQQYTDQPVWVNQGETIYAKGIDKYGNETRIVSSYTASVGDALTIEAFDGNNSTYATAKAANRYIRVDSSMSGKNIRVYWGCGSFASVVMIFMNENKIEISRTTISQTTTALYNVPSGTRWIAYLASDQKPGSIYEVSVVE